MGIPYGTLRGAMTPNMKVLKTVKPVSVKKHGDSFIVDLGQNIAGWLKTRIEGVNAGDTVSIIFSENIHPDGSLNRGQLPPCAVLPTNTCRRHRARPLVVTHIRVPRLPLRPKSKA